MKKIIFLLLTILSFAVSAQHVVVFSANKTISLDTLKTYTAIFLKPTSANKNVSLTNYTPATGTRVVNLSNISTTLRVLINGRDTLSPGHTILYQWAGSSWTPCIPDMRKYYAVHGDTMDGPVNIGGSYPIQNVNVPSNNIVIGATGLNINASSQMGISTDQDLSIYAQNGIVYTNDTRHSYWYPDYLLVSTAQTELKFVADTVGGSGSGIVYNDLNNSHTYQVQFPESLSGDYILQAPQGSGTIARTSDLDNYVKLINGSIQFDYPSTDELLISTDNGVLTRTYLDMTPFNVILGYAGTNYFNCSPTDASLYATNPGSIIGLTSSGNVEVNTGVGSSFMLNTGSSFSAFIETDNITGSDKTIQMPNASGTAVLNDNTAALTNKTYNGVTLSGSSSPSLAVTGTTTLSGTHSGASSGTNTGDQTITLTGDVTGSGTGSFATTIGASKVTNSMLFGGIAYSKLSLSGAILNSDLAGSIAYSKLLLTGSILNADLAGSIAYSKLSLTNSVISGDIVSLAWSKITGTPTTLAGYGITDNIALTTGKLSQFASTTSAELYGTLSDETGSPGGVAVFNNGPVLIGPTLGVATATSINKITVTAPASGATITLADGSVFQLSGAFLTNLIATAATTATLPTGTYTIAKTADVQTFTSNGTWTKPTGAKSCFVLCIGPGGGGGSGRKSASLTLATGGGGGGSGGAAMMTFPAADLTATVAVVVSAGGTGAPSQTTNSTDGTAGGQGSSSSAFGGYLQGTRAGAGAGGTALGAAAGGTAPTCMYNGQVGGASSATGGIGANGGNPSYSGTSGGAGGGITTLAAAAAGGNGGVFNAIPGSTAAAGGAVNTNGTAGTAYEYCGTGGGGGGGSTTTNAGSGGNGANYGSGGGGGGAALDGVGNSGAGGNGGGGLVVVITYF